MYGALAPDTETTEGTVEVRAPVPRHLTADPLADPIDEPNRGDPTNGRHEREGRQLSSMSHPKPDSRKTAPTPSFKNLAPPAYFAWKIALAKL